MSEDQSENREKLQSTEPSGLSFAVTLLAALGTIIWVTYNYLQTTPIDPFWYRSVCVLIPVAVIFGGGLIFYILIKGYAMEVQDSKFLEKLAKYIYMVVFSISIMLLVFIFGIWLLEYVLKTENPVIEILVSLIIPVTVGTFFLLPLLRRKRKETILNVFGIILNVFGIMIFVLIALMILWGYLSTPVLYSPLQGHVTVDMESIYYKNDAPIPVLIHITGPNTNLSINLLKEDSGHNLSEIDKIKYLEPEPNLHNTVGENSTLVGNALSYGTYNVFINTADLGVGYYELRCERQGYEKTYGVHGFYLVNSSQHSVIEERNAS